MEDRREELQKLQEDLAYKSPQDIIRESFMTLPLSDLKAVTYIAGLLDAFRRVGVLDDQEYLDFYIALDILKQGGK